MNLRLLTRIEGHLWGWMSLAMRYPRFMISALVVLAAIGTILAATGLGVNSDTSQMVSSKLDYRQSQLDFEQAFPDEETRIALVVRARSEDEADAFSIRVAEVLRERTDVVSDVFAASVDPFLVQNGLLFLESDELDELLGNITAAGPILKRLGRSPTMDRLYLALADALEPIDEGEPVPEALERAMESIANTIEQRLAGTPEPLSWQDIFHTPDDDDDIHQRVISISPVLDMSSLQPARPAVLAIDKAISEVVAEGAFDVSASITGNAVLRTEELASVTEGIGLSLTLSFMFIIILLMIALRSAVLVFTSLMALIITILITAGFAALMFDALNLVSVAFMVLLVGLGIDFMIHLAMHVQEERMNGLQCRDAIFKSNRLIGSALALCAPTSAIAFFAFAPTQFTGMTQLGIVSGFGVLVAFVVAVTLLPAVFALLPANAGVRRRDGLKNVIIPKLNYSGPFRTVVALLAIGTGAAAVTLLPQVRFDADPMSLRDPEAPSVRAFDLLFEGDGSQPYNLSLLVDDQDQADEIIPRLEALNVVKEVVGPADLVPDNQYEKLDLIDWASIGLSLVFADEDETPDRVIAGAKDRLDDQFNQLSNDALSRLEVAITSLDVAIVADPSILEAVEGDIFRYWSMQYDRLRQQIYPSEITYDDLPRSLASRFRAQDGRLRLQIEPAMDLREQAARSTFVDQVRNVAPGAAGSARSVLESGRVISEAMVIACAVAWIAVAILLATILRDAVLVSVILFSLALAATLTSAAAVLLNVPFNFANIIAIPLLVGVGADSGIHLGIRARRGRTAAAVYETSTPRAVFFSAITTICSFGTLILSAHRGVASMGILLTLAIGFTLICTILVQPWLLDALSRRKAEPA
ncbi:MAG: MMPL family transporter [Pseudomonadota bacterium]